MAPWAAPMFAVPKKNGDIRLVVDYRYLNSVTVPDPYVMPRIEVLLEAMGAASIFTKLDLKNKKGYYQVAVNQNIKTRPHLSHLLASEMHRRHFSD